MHPTGQHPEKLISPQDIQIKDYVYELPEEQIARFPLPERDMAKLLVYRKGRIQASVFRELPDLVPQGALLLFNDTRVIQARMYFHTPAGDPIEVFCLEPLAPIDYIQNFSACDAVRWKALVGNNRKWKSGLLSKEIATPIGSVHLQVTRIGRYHDAFELEFSWNQPLAFAEVLHYAGIIPLPPYLNRESTPEDQLRYQTVYAREKGSVAAPTAGLHFTDRVLQALSDRRIDLQFATLHVGAGTFKPVQPGPLSAHHMHQEHISLSRQTLEALHGAVQQGRPIIPVGTTSLRTLESLYWFAASAQHTEVPAHIPLQVRVNQWDPYQQDVSEFSAEQALQWIIQQMDIHQQPSLEGHTQVLIAPGYSFKLAKGLITNFHQPGSTLLLLIAALLGPSWREVYTYALQHDFRFLSYGDSSLLLPE